MTETDRKMKVISSCLVPFYMDFTAEDTEGTEENFVHTGADLSQIIIFSLL